MFPVVMTAWAAVSGVALWAVEADPVSIIVNYGALGIFVMLFVTGQVRTKSEVDGLKEQITALRNIIQAFQSTTTRQTLPALTRSAEVLEAIPQNDIAMRDLSTLITRLEELAEGEGRDRR